MTLAIMDLKSYEFLEVNVVILQCDCLILGGTNLVN